MSVDWFRCKIKQLKTDIKAYIIAWKAYQTDCHSVSSTVANVPCVCELLVLFWVIRTVHASLLALIDKLNIALHFAYLVSVSQYAGHRRSLLGKPQRVDCVLVFSYWLLIFSIVPLYSSSSSEQPCRYVRWRALLSVDNSNTGSSGSCHDTGRSTCDGCNYSYYQWQYLPIGIHPSA